MSWLEDLIGSLQNGGAPQVGALGASPFPDVPKDPAEAEAAAADAAREAAAVRYMRANKRRIDNAPDAGSAGIQLALGNAPEGSGVPGILGAQPISPTEQAMQALVGGKPAGIPAGAPDGSPFGAPASMSAFGMTTVPPSMQLASSMTGAPPHGQQPPPLPPAQDVVPLPQPRPMEADQPPSTDVGAARRAPLGMSGAGGGASAAINAPQPSQPPGGIGFGQALMGVGAALQGDGGAMTNALVKQITDKGQQQQSMNLTATALLKKGAPAEDVAAAVKSPELLKALVQQYYGKDKFSVVKTGEYEDTDGNKRGVYSVFNANDGTQQEIKAASADEAQSIASRTITGPDGKQIQIPEGVNRKEFIKKMSDHAADAAAGKMTETQAKASSFATRMVQAENSLQTLQNEGLSLSGKVKGEIPGGNYLQSKNYQQYKQAASQFITAVLRQESGAAINKSEFDRYEKEFFPQPGDDPSVVSQKAAARAAAIDQMQRSAGPSYARNQSETSAAAASKPKGGSGTTASGIPWSVN